MAVKCYFYALLFLLTLVSCISDIKGNPAIAIGYDPMDVCIENCAQCKKMLGNWFEGPLCARYCIKFKGKMIPNCENYNSISPFLNKL